MKVNGPYKQPAEESPNITGGRRAPHIHEDQGRGSLGRCRILRDWRYYCSHSTVLCK